MCEPTSLEEFRAGVLAKRTRELLITGPAPRHVHRGDKVTEKNSGNQYICLEAYPDGRIAVCIEGVKRVLQRYQFEVA